MAHRSARSAEPYNARMSTTGLRAALELTELGAQLLAQRYRREHPGASEEEVRRSVARWLSDRSQAPEGNGWGRPVAWPRTT
jgi:hypothetical protein